MVSAELIRRAGNEALSVNPTVATIDITTHGSDFLWFVFSAMAFTTLAVAFFTGFAVKEGQRTFHHLSVMITATASIAYFCLASDLGATPIPVEFNAGVHPGVAVVTRSIWYVRYIDWVITTPLLLLELLLVTGLPLSDIVVTIFFDEVMIITGLVGALVQSTYKWGLWTFGTCAMFYVFYVLYVPGLKSASKTADAKQAYLTGAMILSGLWLLYPLAWGLADGSSTISPDSEMVFYGILDLFAKPVFAIVHLWSLRKIDYTVFQLNSGKHSDFANMETGTVSHEPKAAEKTVEGNGSGGSPTGVADSTVHGH